MGRPRSRGWQRGVPEDPRQCKSSFSPCGAPRSGIPNSTSHRSPATCWLSECRPLDASGGRGRLKGDKNHTSTTRVCTATASNVSKVDTCTAAKAPAADLIGTGRAYRTIGKTAWMDGPSPVLDAPWPAQAMKCACCKQYLRGRYLTRPTSHVLVLSRPTRCGR